MSDTTPTGGSDPNEPGWPGTTPPPGASPPPASPPPAGPPAGPPTSPPGPPTGPAPPPQSGPPTGPGQGFPSPGGAPPPPGSWPSAVPHDPTAGYGSAGPWSEQQQFTPGYQPWVSARRNEPMAGWSLGVSIFSLACCQLTAPVGIVLAVLAMRKIDAQPQLFTGRGLAVAGLVIGIIATAFLVLQAVLYATGSATMWTTR